MIPQKDGADITAQSAQMIEVAAVRLSQWNSRRHLDDKAIDGLAKSIRNQGLLNPIHVRASKGAATFEVLAGERRLRACQQLKLKEIPAVVLDVDDQEAHEIRVVENMEREDLAPLEEGAAVKLLLDGKDATVESVAARLGRSRGWVARRARLSSLDPKLIKTTLQGWSVDALEEVARLDAKQQHEAAERFRYHVPTGTQVRGWVQEELLRKLSAAPFSVDMKELAPKTPTCRACQKRTANEPALFEDLGAKDGELGSCLDPACWQRKVAAHTLATFDKLAETNEDLHVMDAAGYGYGPHGELPAKLAPHRISAHEWQKTKKTDPKARPVLVFGGPQAGKVVHMRPITRTSQREAGAKSKTMEERRKALAGRRAKVFNTKAIDQLDEILKTRTIPKCVTEKMILAAAECFGIDGLRHGGTLDPSGKSRWSRYHGRARAKPVELRKAILLQVIDVWRGAIAQENMYQPISSAYATEAARFFGLPVADMNKAAAEACPEPKSWANLKAEGAKPKARTKGKATAKSKK